VESSLVGASCEPVSPLNGLLGEEVGLSFVPVVTGMRVLEIGEHHHRLADVVLVGEAQPQGASTLTRVPKVERLSLRIVDD